MNDTLGQIKECDTLVQVIPPYSYYDSLYGSITAGKTYSTSAFNAYKMSQQWQMMDTAKKVYRKLPTLVRDYTAELQVALLNASGIDPIKTRVVNDLNGEDVDLKAHLGELAKRIVNGDITTITGQPTEIVDKLNTVVQQFKLANAKGLSEKLVTAQVGDKFEVAQVGMMEVVDTTFIPWSVDNEINGLKLTKTPTIVFGALDE